MCNSAALRHCSVDVLWVAARLPAQIFRLISNAGGALVCLKHGIPLSKRGGQLLKKAAYRNRSTVPPSPSPGGESSCSAGDVDSPVEQKQPHIHGPADISGTGSAARTARVSVKERPLLAAPHVGWHLLVPYMCDRSRWTAH